MYGSKSDYLIQKSCCCVTKDREKSPIKEISNPMPLDSMFRSDTNSNTMQTKSNVARTYDNEYNVHKNNSTFPRATRSVLPQVPLDAFDKTDLLRNQTRGALYQEIVDDDDKLNVNHLKSSRPKPCNSYKQEENRKQLDLSFITSRILVVYTSQPFHDENNKILRSLRHEYKKNLKVFHLTIRSTIDDQDKTVLNTVSSLPHLMPFLDDIYNFLTAVTSWLQKTKKNIILLNCSEKTNHLCAICLRFIVTHEEMNKRLLRIDNLILSDHEINALQFYEKVNMEKHHTSSLKRYTSTVSNIMLNIIQYQPNLKHLHIIVLRNIHSIDRHYEGVKDKDHNASDGKLSSIYLNIYQNFHLIHSTYRVTLNEEIETDRIIYIIDPIVPINGDILVMANITNKAGFQSIYFRIQFHTCLLHGDVASFKYSELDNSRKTDTQSRKIGLVELHLRSQPNLVRDNENMLHSYKYFMIRERGSQSRDILSQLKLLDQGDKGGGLSYTAGPVDGNLYAAIPRLCKHPANISKYENAKIIQKNHAATSNTPFILKKFHNLENEITDAAASITTATSKKGSFQSDVKPEKHGLPCCEDGTSALRINSMKATKHQPGSFVPYRKSMSLSNSELPIKANRDEREYFISYSSNRAQKKIVANSSTSNSVNPDNTSPYDNLFPQNTAQKLPQYHEIYEEAFTPANIVQEHNYESIDVANEVEIRKKFLSNLNEPRNTIDRRESIKNNQLTMHDKPNDQVDSEFMLYDNDEFTDSKALYHVLVSRSLWFKPNFSRHDAILYLLDQPVGYFLVRSSTSLSKSLSIVLKCSTSIMNKDIIENDSLDNIRHFIIDYNSEGYKIRGFSNERYYSDLTRLICDHLDNKIGLPCGLVLPHSEKDNKEQISKENYTCQDRYINSNVLSPAVNNYNVIYLGSFITKQLSDITAIAASIDTLQSRVYQMPLEYSYNSLTKMSLKITYDRIIFTDINRKMFFRKHCKLEDILCCEVDPKRRVWSHMSGLNNSSQIPNFSPIFGLVSSLTTNTEFNNQTCCQLFLAMGYDAEDFCSTVNQARNKINKCN